MQLHLKLYHLLLLLTCAGTHAAAQDSLSLKEAMRQAVSQNLQVKKAELDIGLMRDRSRMEQSIIYPQVSGQMNLDYFPLLPTSLVPGEFVNQPGTYIPVQFGQPWQTTGQVSVSQLLYNEAYRRAIPARRLSVELSKTLLEKTKEDVAWQVAQLYLQIQQTEAVGAALHTQEQRLVALEKSVRASVENGFAVKTDLTKVQLTAQQLQAQRQQLHDAIAYQKELLCFLIGRQPDTSLSLVATEPGLAVKKETRKTAELLAVEHGLALQQLQIRSVQAERQPDVRAYATGLVQSQRQNPNFFAPDNRWFGMGAVGIRAHIPIVDGGKLKKRVSQLETERQKTALDYQRLSEMQAIELRNAERGIASAVTQTNQARESVALAKEVLDALQRQYREGTQPLSELLTAQAALAEAESQLAMKSIAVVLAELKYLKLAGRLSEWW